MTWPKNKHFTKTTDAMIHPAILQITMMIWRIYVDCRMIMPIIITLVSIYRPLLR